MDAGQLGAPNSSTSRSKRISLFQRNVVVVSSGRATPSLSLPAVDRLAGFLADLGRLRALEAAWDGCLRSRRSSDIEIRAPSSTLADLDWDGEHCASAAAPASLRNRTVCIMLPSTFAASMIKWYFTTG